MRAPGQVPDMPELLSASPRLTSDLTFPLAFACHCPALLTQLRICALLVKVLPALWSPSAPGLCSLLEQLCSCCSLASSSGLPEPGAEYHGACCPGCARVCPQELTQAAHRGLPLWFPLLLLADIQSCGRHAEADSSPSGFFRIPCTHSNLCPPAP